MALVKYNNNSISAITTPGSVATGAMVLIKEQTASSSATISFVNGTSDVTFDGTYPIYLFQYIGIHPETNAQNFTVGFRDGSTDYDATKTTTFFAGNNDEAAASASLAYETGRDIAQGTGFQILNNSVGGDNDQCCSGNLWVFSPSSTTYVKHFMLQSNNAHSDNANLSQYMAGYCNTTTAIDAVQFKFASGDIDSGKIKLYGIKDS